MHACTTTHATTHAASHGPVQVRHCSTRYSTPRCSTRDNTHTRHRKHNIPPSSSSSSHLQLPLQALDKHAGRHVRLAFAGDDDAGEAVVESILRETHERRILLHDDNELRLALHLRDTVDVPVCVKRAEKCMRTLRVRTIARASYKTDLRFE